MKEESILIKFIPASPSKNCSNFFEKYFPHYLGKEKKEKEQ